MSDESQQNVTKCPNCGTEWHPLDTPNPDRERLNAHCHRVADLLSERDRYRAALDTISGMPAWDNTTAAMLEVADKALGD